VDENEVKAINIAGIQNHPIKVTLGLLVAIFVIGFGTKAWVVEQISVDFFTIANAEEHVRVVSQRLDTMQSQMDTQSTSITGLTTEVRLASAFQIERGVKNDLAQHLASRPSPETTRWRIDHSQLEAKVSIAEQYKTCVLAESKNCELLQRQLWQ